MTQTRCVTKAESLKTLANIQRCYKTHDQRSRSMCRVQWLTLHTGISRKHIHDILPDVIHRFPARIRGSADTIPLEIHLQRRPRFSTGFIKVCTNARFLQTMPRTLVLRYSCQLAAFRGTRRVACNERVSRTRKYLHVTGLPTRVKFLWNVPGLALIVSVLTTKPNLSVNGLVPRRKPAWTLIKGDSTSTVILDLCWHTGRGKRLWSFKNV